MPNNPPDGGEKWATKYAGRDTDGDWDISVGGKWLFTIPYDGPDTSDRMVNTLNTAATAYRKQGIKEFAERVALIAERKANEETNLMENTAGEFGEPLRLGMALEIAAEIRKMAEEA